MIKRDFFIKTAALCGACAMIFDVIIITFLGSLTPNYNPFRQYISELGSHSSPYSSFLNTWWGVFSFLGIIFALGLYKSIRKSRLSWLGPLAIGVEMITGGILAGLFPCDLGCAGNSFSNQMHLLINGFGMIISVFIPIFLIISIRGDKKWKQLQIFFIVIQIIMIFVAGCFFYQEYLFLFFNKEYASGFFQRLNMLVFYLSLLVPAFYLTFRY